MSNNGVYGFYFAATAGPARETRGIVQTCKIYNNGDDNIHVSFPMSESGHQYLKILNCTIYGGGDEGIYVTPQAPWANTNLNVTCINTISHNNTGSEFEATNDIRVTLTADYNCGGGGTYAGKWSQGDNDVTIDPLFANADNNNFTLKSNSSCIDSGTDVELTEDFTGRPIPQGTGYDIGAYEQTENSRGNRGSGCFIATAAYGSATEPRVKVLCEFRDRFLLTSKLGKAFVDFYYACSPPMAHFIESHGSVRSLVRWGLLPLIGACRVTMHLGPAATSLLVLLVLLSASVIVLFSRKK